MQKQLLLSIVLSCVSIALLSCTNISDDEIDAAITNEPPSRTEPAENDGSVREAGGSSMDEVAILSNTLIQLSEPLDEPEYYCIDVPGFRQSLNLEGALTAHTCKPNADDELFTINYPAEGKIYMPAYERCMEARTATASAELFMAECSNSPLQQFTYNSDGMIQLQIGEQKTFCITVADEAGKPTGGPSHVVRELMLLFCSDVSAALSQWVFPGSAVP